MSFPTMESGGSFTGAWRLENYAMQKIQQNGTYENGWDYDLHEFVQIKIPDRFLPSRNEWHQIAKSLFFANLSELLAMAKEKVIDEYETYYIKHLESCINIPHPHENFGDREKIQKDSKQKILNFLQNIKETIREENQTMLEIRKDGVWEFAFDYEIDKPSMILIPDHFHPPANEDQNVNANLCLLKTSALLQMAKEKATDDRDSYYIKHLESSFNLPHPYENPDDRGNMQKEVRQKLMNFLIWIISKTSTDMSKQVPNSESCST